MEALIFQAFVERGSNPPSAPATTKRNCEHVDNSAQQGLFAAAAMSQLCHFRPRRSGEQVPMSATPQKRKLLRHTAFDAAAGGQLAGTTAFDERSLGFGQRAGRCCPL